MDLHICVTAEMDISAGSVSAGQNHNGRMDPGMNNEHLDRIYAHIKSKYVRIYICDNGYQLFR